MAATRRTQGCALVKWRAPGPVDCKGGLKARETAQAPRSCSDSTCVLGGGGQDAGISDLFRQITAGPYSFRPEVKAPSSLLSL